MDMSVQILNEMKKCIAKWTNSLTQINKTIGEVSTTLRERTVIIEKKPRQQQTFKGMMSSYYKKHLVNNMYH